MAWIDDIITPTLPYHRQVTKQFPYTSSEGTDNVRYIMTWFRMAYPGCRYKALAAMCGCFNGESRLNPAAILGFRDYAYLFANRKKAFGIVQFVPGCLPTDHDEQYWQNYHGNGKPIFYYYLKNKGLGTNIHTLYTDTGYATDLRVQLQYISDGNGWKRQTSTSYNPVYNKSYTGSFRDFLYDETQDLGNTTAWFYAGFIRSGGPSTALPAYIRFANGVYDKFVSEFGDDVPIPPKPPTRPRNFIIIAKASGLF